MDNQEVINIWETYYADRGLDIDLSRKYIKYIKPLLGNNVPIVFDFVHLAKLLGRKTDYLASVVNSSNSHYREFKIKKRNGGFRDISVPYPALLEMQYWIYNNILLKIPIHSCSHGFARKKSIITNAKLHLKQEHLLKLDLTDFFPSISIARVIKVFKNLGYTTNVSYYLASICSLENALPQGAPTSPYLSNIITHDLDNRLIKFAKKLNLKYTRYADDLTFSGHDIPAKYIEYISAIISSEGFTVNNLKTRLYKEGGKRIVTGISVADEKMKVPREYKRKVRKEIHFIQKYGLYSHITKSRIKIPYYLESMIGKLNFWKSVEPDSKYVLEKIQYLKELKKTTIEKVS